MKAPIYLAFSLNIPPKFAEYRLPLLIDHVAKVIILRREITLYSDRWVIIDYPDDMTSTDAIKEVVDRLAANP